MGFDVDVVERGEERGEVSSESLLRGVPEQTPGPGAPVLDEAVAREPSLEGAR